MRDYTFSDAKFMSAKEKQIVLNHWRRFIDSGFQSKYFTKQLYNHLYLHHAFIAHYNLHGFYYTYFGDNPFSNPNLKTFLDHFNSGSEYYFLWVYNDPDYGDICTAMAMEIKPLLSSFYSRIEREIAQDEIAYALYLLEKHGVDIEDLKGRLRR